jgi:hypothetical protein
MLFVVGGKIVHQQVGAVPEPFLRDMIEAMLETVPTGGEEVAH